MYQYTPQDQRIVDERVADFRDQVRRRLSGELTEAEFRPLRLMNGLYLQRHAYMLRVAIPYGLLDTRQVRMLAHIARTYDKGYGHITTRQNIQYNWPRLEEVPDLLADLASVQMHVIQTSGNCVRNVTADHLSGVAGDELEDPRPYCELLRQFSTFHPEFMYLPRKFKIAMTGRQEDAAAIAVQTARPQATIVMSVPARRIAALPNGTRSSGSISGMPPRMIILRREAMPSLSAGSPGKAGPRVWRYIHLGSRQMTGPRYSAAVMSRP